jgi:FMN phosphatase YigB (HAD superfamily)
VNVPAGAALMVGDSVRQDIDGALAAGMRAALLYRGDGQHECERTLAARGVPTIRSLRELGNWVIG